MVIKEKRFDVCSGMSLWAMSLFDEDDREATADSSDVKKCRKTSSFHVDSIDFWEEHLPPRVCLQELVFFTFSLHFQVGCRESEVYFMSYMLHLICELQRYFREE